MRQVLESSNYCVAPIDVYGLLKGKRVNRLQLFGYFKMTTLISTCQGCSWWVSCGGRAISFSMNGS